MDSLSSSSFGSNPDHSRWNNRHEDLKRVAKSSLHHTEFEGNMNSRLDKARNFAKGKRTFLQDRDSREKVAMTVPSMQKNTLVLLRHEKKQYVVSKGPPVKDSPSKARSTSCGSDKIQFKNGLNTEMAGKRSLSQELSVDKDCKRFFKISPNHSSAMEGVEADKDVSRSGKEAKLHFRLPKRTGISTDKVSWNSRSSAHKAHEKGEIFRSYAGKSHDKRKLSYSTALAGEERVLEAPISFPNITKRARSERKRDDRCKSQSSISASLDGFVAELEEALLRKQDSAVDSGARLLADLEDQRDDSRGVDTSFKTDGNEARHDDHNLSQKDVQLEETSEREEGELEPDEEDLLKEHHLAIGIDAGKCALQPESNTCESGHTTDTPMEDCQNKCLDSLKHESVPARDNIFCVSPVSNPSNACESDAKDSSAGKGDQSQAVVDIVTEHVHGHQGSSAVAGKGGGQSQEEVMHVNNSQGPTRLCHNFCLNDTVPSSTTEGEVDARLQDASTVAIIHTEAASAAKGFGLEKLSLSLSMQLAEPVDEALKDDSHKCCGEWDESGNENSSADGPILQADIDVKRGLPPHVEESDELSVYNNKHKKLKVGSLQLSLALPGSPIISTKSLPPNMENQQKSEKTHQLLRHTRSFSHCQTETFSDGFTTSLSLSSFIHNPSCALNCISREDQELSWGGSRVLQQGHMQNPGGGDKDVNRSVTSLFKDRLKQKFEGPLHQQASQNGKLCKVNGFSCGGDRGHQDRHSKELAGARSPSSIDKIGLHEIALEPVAVMAQKLQELPDTFLEGLKALAEELLGSFAKRDEILALQHILSKRTDLTEQTLLRAHPTQLDILVALRTGTKGFVQKGTQTLTYKSLIEIFLQTRCRNVDCQQTLPVNRCECQVCLEKSGFCHECMCMVCSKFDSDSNTSYWVGCDVCMHWCHTDCGIRMSHIKPTPVSCGGAMEMQYRCLSCGHHMELFGFVKGVFTNFAASWSVEMLTKELDCIRRIFHGSEDARGKQLYRIAEKMLQHLEANVGARDVCSSMLHFFSGFDCVQDGRVSLPLKQENLSEANAPKDPKTMGSVVEGKAAEVDQIASRISRMAREELNGIIQKKLSDSLMLQARADAARQDATNLQQLVASKTRMLEEDFAFKYSLLRLEEAEERRRKRLHELQALEKSQHSYEVMKLRIESDIKNLMMKVDRPKLQPA